MVIAERSLSIEDGHEPKACKITMHAPEDADGMWICRYTIGWPIAPEESFGAGMDALQALHLTLQQIGIARYASAYHKAGNLVFDRPGRGYGFPMPKNGRDLLIGDDTIFDG